MYVNTQFLKMFGLNLEARDVNEALEKNNLFGKVTSLLF